MRRGGIARSTENESFVGVTVYSVFLACQASELDFEFDQLDDVILGIDPVFPSVR